MEQTLGKRIMENRKRLKMTQEQLAEMLGVTAQAVSKWENDQSCPDIGILPRISDIFGISTDELLGHSNTQKSFEAEIVDEEENESNGVRFQNGNWEFKWNSKKRHSIGIAVFVLAVGVLYLLVQLFQWPLSLWDVSWPTAIFVFGLWGLLGHFSFFQLGCTLFGGFALADKLFQFSFDVDGRIIWAVLLLLFGGSLLVDAMKKNRKPIFQISGPSNKQQADYTYHISEDSFAFSRSFGEQKQPIYLKTLRQGDINVSFGEYTVDLTKIENITANCIINAQCSFGELHLLVPRRYQVVIKNSGAFSDIEITGEPDENAVEKILLDGNVSFGEIEIQYK